MKIETKRYRSLSYVNAIQINEDTIDYLGEKCCWTKKNNIWYTRTFNGKEKKVNYGDYIVFNNSNGFSKYCVDKDVFESTYSLDE